VWFVRLVLSILAGVTSLFLLVPSGCNDVGGVPSWERCTSLLGLPTPLLGEVLGLGGLWDVILPFALAVIISVMIWLVLESSLGRGRHE
jgi:hypothetical protein